MKLKYKQFAFIALIILALLLSVFAASASPLKGFEITECSCNLISNPIEIENTGRYVEGYHVYQSGRAVKWAEIFPEIVILEPGETAVVDNFIKIPCDVKGTSRLTTEIRASEYSEYFIQEIEVIDCYNLNEEEFDSSKMIHLFLKSSMILLALLFIFLLLFLLLGPVERLFYRSVNVKAPKEKRKKKKKERKARKKLLSPSSKALLLKIFALIVLIVLAVFVTKNIINLVSEQDDYSLEIIEFEEVIEETEPVEDEEDIEVSEEKKYPLKCLEDNKLYLIYSAAGFAILLSILFIFIKLRNKPKIAKKKGCKVKKICFDVWGWIVLRWKLILCIILFTIVILLVYVFRASISGFLASLKDYVLIYLTYVILGFVLLGILIFVFLKLNK